MSETVEARLLELLENATEKLQKIDTGLALQTQMLQAHTDADSSNFDALRATLTLVQLKLEAIELARAREEGAKEAEASAHKYSAVKWGGGGAAILTAVAEAIRQFWPHSN